MQEVDRLLGQVLGGGGGTSTAPWALSPLGPSHGSAWELWSQVEEPRGLVYLLIARLLLGLAFVGALLVVAGRPVDPPGRPRSWEPTELSQLLWYALALAKLVETLLVVLAIAAVDEGRAPGTALVLGLTVATWVARAVAVLFIAAIVGRRRQVRIAAQRSAGLRRWSRALWHHRLSLVVVAVIAGLALVPGPDLSDQFPDVIRGWVGNGRVGVAHFVFTFAAIWVAWGGLAILGRLRSERDVYKYAFSLAAPHRPPSPLYLVVPVIVVVTAVVLRLAGRGDLIRPFGLLTVSLVPLLAWWVSWWIFATTAGAVEIERPVVLARVVIERPLVLLRRAMLGVLVVLPLLLVGLNPGFWLLPVLAAVALLVGPASIRPWPAPRSATDEMSGVGPDLAGFDPRRALDTVQTGDVLATGLTVVGGLALIRAYIAPLVVGFGWFGSRAGWGTRSAQLLLIGLGIAVVFTWPIAADWLLARRRWFGRRLPNPVTDREADSMRVAVVVSGRDYKEPPAQTDEVRSLRSQKLELIAFAMAAAVPVVLTIWPVVLVRVFGGVAVVLAAMTAWAYLIGFPIVLLQRQRPLDIFRVLGARAAPVLTMILVVLVINSMGGGDRLLHVPRPPTEVGAAPLNRPDLAEAFGDWVEASAACDRPVTTVSVEVTGEVVEEAIAARPLVLVAAAGGGIRAAVWTGLTMETFDGPCSADAVFLSSGVSGGSVGLAASRVPERGATELAAMAQPDGLASAATGLLVTDPLAVTTGLRVPSRVAGRWEWRDRSALMEDAWHHRFVRRQLIPTGLAEPWSAERAGPAGFLLLNSADAGTGCRVFLSQIEFETAAFDAPEDEPPRCRARSGLPPASTDLISFFGACTPAMDWLTASMLSARFPIVTPAGRAPGPSREQSGRECDQKRHNLQLIDGGYAEGSGLGSLFDVAPQIMALVRDYNEQVSLTRLAAAEAVDAVQDTLTESDEEIVGSVTRRSSYLVPLVVFVENHTGSDVAAASAPLSIEALVPLAGLGARDLQSAPSTWLQRLTDVIAAPCPIGDRDCDRVVAALHTELHEPSGGVVVVAPSTEPGVAAPLGWTLSPDSRQRLRSAVDAQAEGCPEVRPGGDYACLAELLGVLDVDDQPTD